MQKTTSRNFAQLRGLRATTSRTLRGEVLAKSKTPSQPKHPPYYGVVVDFHGGAQCRVRDEVTDFAPASDGRTRHSKLQAAKMIFIDFTVRFSSARARSDDITRGRDLRAFLLERVPAVVWSKRPVLADTRATPELFVSGSPLRAAAELCASGSPLPGSPSPAALFWTLSGHSGVNH
jgi:hypothetical protein